MPRPRLINEPTRVHLVLEKKVKDHAIRFAAQRGLSLGQYVSMLIQHQLSQELLRNSQPEAAHFFLHMHPDNSQLGSK